MLRPIRHARLAASLLACLCGGAQAQAPAPPLPAAGDANAAASAAADPIATLDTVTVTGTHIRGVDTENEHPVMVLERAELLRSGLTSLADIVQAQVVANGATLNRNVNNNGDSTRGELRVNLRSLGANRTLVLLNGQRFVSAIDGAVDLSAIPLALVERVEVLKDGASAIYGSDAIGGVINIITRRKYDGGELGLYGARTDHDDGTRRHVDLSFGGGGERWNAALGVEYDDDDPIIASSRTISARSAPGLPPDATGSSATQYGVFRVPGMGPIMLIPGRPGTSPDDFRPRNPATDSNYNPAPYSYLQTPQRRRAGFGQLRFEVSPSLAVSADALFNQRRSAQQLAPPVVNFSTIAFAGTPQAFGVSAESIYNPFGAPVAGVLTRWPDDEPRRFEQTVDTTRFHLGLDGRFDAFGRGWIWGVDATRTRAAQREFAGPYADNDRLRLALGPSFFDADGVARCGRPEAVIEGCVPLRLFTGPDRFTPAMLDYVNVDTRSRQSARSDVLDLHLTSALADLPAGPLGFAAGLERHLERGRDDPDPLVAAGRANGTGVSYAPTQGAYSVNEAYAEFDIPLLGDRPFVRELDVNLATRYADYSLFGHTDNSRLGLRWKPLDALLVRSTWAQGFRAPSIFEVFGGTREGGGDINDLCAAHDQYVPPPAVAANCLAHGVPADVPPPFAVSIASGSNRDLRPETSRSLTAGLVYSPPGLAGLDASLDWYRIRIRHAIGNPGPQYFVDACYLRDDPGACAHLTRQSSGELVHILAIEQNLPGGLETEGWDFALAWKRATPLGEISLRWESAYVSYWGEIGQPAYGTPLPDGSRAQGNVAGSNNPLYGVNWRLRSVATLAWQRQSVGASIGARYFSPIKEDCIDVTDVAEAVGDPSLRSLCSEPDRMLDGSPAPRNRVGAVTYVDLEAGWVAPWKGRFTLGVRNALDREPPHAWSYSGFNSFFPDYDVPGRFWYASYRQTF